MTRMLRVGLAVVLGMVVAPALAEACHGCKKTPCVVAPAPAYECVTEMVPYTVMKTRTRIDYKPVTKTVMAREAVTTYVTRSCVVKKPVTETHMVTRTYNVSRPVYETQMTTRTETICRPVTTTRLVTETCMQPTSWTETVPVVAKRGGCCGMGLLCGKLHGGKCGGLTQVGCKTVTRTCYTPVPVTREVVETRMVSDVRTVQVPVTTCRMVTEQKVESVPVTTCRLVEEVITRQVPVTTYHCVPKTVTRMVPVKVKECVPVTCYKKVRKMVPVCTTPVHETLASVDHAAPQVGQYDVLTAAPQSFGSGSPQVIEKGSPQVTSPPPVPQK